MDRQCPSCGGFCKKSGCERENVKPKMKRAQLIDIAGEACSCWSHDQKLEFTFTTADLRKLFRLYDELKEKNGG